jgi:hypothetical protein
MGEHDKVLEKVRKLLALAGSSNEHEAALAASRAQALLAEHNLTLADVKAEKGDEFVIDEELVTDSYPWRRQLANAVASLYFCKYYYQNVRRGRTMYDVHCLAGAPHNINVAKMMFQYLHTTVDRLARQGARGLPKKQQSPYRVSFRTACTTRLLTRIAERIALAKAGRIKSETTGTTLPALASLYNTIGAKLDEFLDEAVGKMKTTKSKMATLDARGAMDGRAAGDKIGLDAQVSGGGAPALEDAIFKRAKVIEKIVCEQYCDEDTDAADLALDELRKDASRSDAEIARHVAQLIMQP